MRSSYLLLLFGNADKWSMHAVNEHGRKLQPDKKDRESAVTRKM